ncbi:hypothetical protein [Microbulbifer rhizosphaerae]|uniref:Uncharacterized protein n=1 Tax=Microbulbifer rhizosphaerae TaxID=1562603 RepID=A0A7W4WE75_9GAMM|nr:hypothetical protein [Microbulbifer rhizosphaerae]MBB3062581.1 hypothetical protein [Microbulbifer rhizosphaerae]
MKPEEVLDSSGKIGLDLLVLGAAYVIHMGSAYIAFSLGGDWYARSGSLLVMFSVYLEYRNFSFTQELNQLAQKEGELSDAEMEELTLPKKRRYLNIVVLVTLVYGTLVWGYGDLL